MKPKDCVIEINTSRFNNEIIAARLSGVPIHDKNVTQNYNIELHVKNKTQHTQMVTTEEFKVKQGDTDIKADRLFPKNSITGDYIEFIRLRASVVIPGEEIKLSCSTSMGTGNENGMYSSVGTCSFSHTFNKEEAEGASSGVPPAERADWMLLDARRTHVVPNSFDFIVDTIGIHTPKEILLLASIVLREQFEQCKTSMTVEPSLTTVKDCFDVKFDGSYQHAKSSIKMKGDYSIGKMIEHAIYTIMYAKTLTSVSFYKKHPHDEFGVLKIAFPDATHELVMERVRQACQACSDELKLFSELVTAEKF